MKKVTIILALLLSSTVTFAQDAVKDSTAVEEAEPKFTAAVDVVYPYLWRGVRYYGDDIAIQPYVGYAFTDKLSVELWATTNITSKADSYFEFDWSISYQISPVMSITLADYYWPATKKNVDWEKSSYFDYSDGSAKTLDLSLLFDFSEKGVPIDFTWSTFIGGGDYKDDADGGRSRAYSSYAEVGYTHTFESAGIDVRPFAGAAVLNEGGYYGTDANGNAGFTFTNVGVNFSKEFKVSENYSLPVFVGYSHNDYGVAKETKTIRNFFSCGVTFNIR
ncbi:hypothetical protein [Flavobacterium sp.]|uniref:hypothetical protein n=1 Tax=Flavobacterium sp. TaxID=239 RepID=UPI00286BA8F0|nr:hypothetical protein [Flavobacterium sp.]